MPSSPTAQPPEPSFAEWCNQTAASAWRGTRDAAIGFMAWIRHEPAQAALWTVLIGGLVYFYAFYNVFMNGTESTAVWAWRGWNEENDQQHCVFILPLMAFLFWYHRDELADAVKEPSTRGMAFVVAGVITFVLAARSLQPRFAIVSAPLIIYGAAEFLGGRAFARVFIFPCLLMLFMIPIGGVVQSTVALQLLASKSVGFVCGLLGIHVQTMGTQIIVDGHPFEVAGGCSGIRSLMAMTMLTALYVHFTQKEAWKQFVIFGCSLLFALVGNSIRLLSVVLVAKWYDPVFAGKQYHDYSGIVFFIFAVLTMVSFSNVLNRDWSGLTRLLSARDPAPAVKDGKSSEQKQKPASPISYDY